MGSRFTTDSSGNELNGFTQYNNQVQSMKETDSGEPGELNYLSASLKPTADVIFDTGGPIFNPNVKTNEL